MEGTEATTSTSATIWSIIHDSPPEFWAGLACGVILRFALGLLRDWTEWKRENANRNHKSKRR